LTRSGQAIAVTGAVLFVLLALVLPADQGLRVAPFDRYGEAVKAGEIPYRDFSLEYPPGAIAAIVPPAFVPDVSYTRAFRTLEASFGALLVLVVALLRTSASAGGDVARLGSVALLPLFLGPIVSYRFDLWPSLLVVVAIACVGSGRFRSGGFALGVAVAAKLYPALLVVPLGVVAHRRGGLRRAAAWAVAGFLLFMLPFSLIAPGGVRFSLTQQLGRKLQIESIGGSIVAAIGAIRGRGVSTRFEDGAWNVHAAGAHWIQSALALVGIALAIGVCWFVFRSRQRIDPLPAYALLVAVVLVFSNVLSPQYLVWLVPLVALMRGVIAYAVAGLLVLAEVISRVLYPSHYEALVALHPAEVSLLVTRNALVLIAAVLLAYSFRDSVRIAHEDS
jgi:Glycosyltransferase family 87